MNWQWWGIICFKCISYVTRKWTSETSRIVPDDFDACSLFRFSLLSTYEDFFCYMLVRKLDLFCQDMLLYFLADCLNALQHQLILALKMALMVDWEGPYWEKKAFSVQWRRGRSRKSVSLRLRDRFWFKLNLCLIFCLFHIHILSQLLKGIHT